MIGVNLRCVSFMVHMRFVISIARLKALQGELFSQMKITVRGLTAWSPLYVFADE